MTKTKGFTNQQINSIVPDADNHDPKFIYYLLSTKGKELKKIAGGAATPIVNKSSFSDFEVEIPSLENQKEVASILSAFDDLIENNTRRIEILEEMARRIYRKWFVHFRYPGHEDDALVDSDTELGEIPEGWEVKSLENLFDISYGKTLPMKDFEEDGKYLVYGAGDVVGRYPDKNIDKKLALITCRGNGSGTVWRTRGEGFVTNNSLILFPKYDYLSYYFNYHLANNSNMKSVITGSAQPQITITNLSTLKAVLPSKEKVELFNKQVKSIYDQIDTLFERNKKLKESRDLLLPKLISGKIQVEEITIN